MGETSSCCNPSTYQMEIDNIVLPNQAFNLEQQTQNIQEFTEPSHEMLETLRKAEEYLSSLQKMDIKVGQEELWQIKAKVNDKPVTIFVRGGAKNEPLNGKAMLYFHNKQIFKGILSNNHPTFGIFVFGKDCYYAGDIKNYNAEGHGKFQNSDSGYTYEGSWSKSLPHGRGTEVYANGDRFEGEMSYGGKFGHGVYSFRNGQYYEGSFYNNQSDGHGKLTYPNGNSYEGEWKLGLFNGHGKFVWANGETYQGEYLQGKRHGKGKYTFKNGSYYQGNWQNGLQSGEGIIKDKFDEIKGVWQNGELIS